MSSATRRRLKTLEAKHKMRAPRVIVFYIRSAFAKADVATLKASLDYPISNSDLLIERVFDREGFEPRVRMF